MSVANLENSKRLYELSGWDDTDEWQHETPAGGIHFFSPVAPTDKCDAPAYPAGYLLRRLPSDDFRIAVLTNDSNRWVANRTTANTVEQQCESDTPEDALCLLAIKLFESGVL